MKKQIFLLLATFLVTSMAFADVLPPREEEKMKTRYSWDEPPVAIRISTDKCGSEVMCTGRVINRNLRAKLRKLTAYCKPLEVNEKKSKVVCPSAYVCAQSSSTNGKFSFSQFDKVDVSRSLDLSGVTSASGDPSAVQGNEQKASEVSH